MSIFDNYLLKLPSNLRRFSQIVPSIRVSMFFSCCDIIGLSKVSQLAISHYPTSEQLATKNLLG